MRGVALPPARSRRAAARVALAVALLVAPVLTGCLVARLPDLIDPPQVTGGGSGTKAPTNTTAVIKTDPVTWSVNDTWVWEGSHGGRITDRVVAVRQVTRDVAGRPLVVTRYDVLTKEEWGGDLLPSWSNHTYEPELGLVDSSARGEAARYLRAGAEFRGLPLTYIGPTWFNHSVELTRRSGTDTFDKSNHVTNDGRKLVSTPAGQFQAWSIRVNVTVDQGPGSPKLYASSSRLFSTEAKNDVQYERRGTTWSLVAYRINNDTRPLEVRALPAAAGWQTGWSWRYTDATGAVLTRDLILCTTMFTQCRDEGKHRFVYYEGRDHFAYRQRIVYGKSAFTQGEIALVPASTLAPVASNFYYATSAPAKWRPDVNWTGSVPTYAPPASDRDHQYRAKGTSAAGPLDHTALARVRLHGAEVVATPIGNLTGVRVHTNTTYLPTNAYGDTFWDEVDRVWSPTIRNDVQITLAFGGVRRTFTLDAVDFGDGRKVERDI